MIEEKLKQAEKVKQKDFQPQLRVKIKNKSIYFYLPIAYKTKDAKLILDGCHQPVLEKNWEGHLLYALPGGGRWNSVLNKRER